MIDTIKPKSSSARLEYEWERQFTALNHHAIVSVTDAAGRITYINDLFCEISGFSRDELLGNTHRLVKSGAHAPVFYSDMWRVIGSGQVWKGEVCNRRKDGSLYWVESTITPFVNENGKPYQYVSIRTDITHVRAAQDALLKQSELQRCLTYTAQRLLAARPEQLASAIDETLASTALKLGADSANLYLIKDESLVLRNSWTSAGSRLSLSASIEECLAFIRYYPTAGTAGLRFLSLSDLYQADSRIKDRISLGGVALAPLYIDEEVTGYIVYAVDEYQPDWCADCGDLIALLADMLSNSVQRFRATSALVAASNEAERASRAKSDFLSSMSHELRTPMNAILGFGQLMEYDDELPAEHKESVHEIIKAGRHLLDLINDILDLAKVESGKLALSLEPVCLKSIIDECLSLIRPLAQKREVFLELKSGPSVRVMADKTRLKQVCLNLLSNAVKYNHEQGRVKISWELVEASKARLIFKDTGKGISGEGLHQLFQPFNRLEAEISGIEGTGIGLTLTKQMIELMGGGIGVESQHGIGSCFWIDIPLIHNHTEDDFDQVDETVRRELSNGVKKVLYVDDNPVNLKLVRKLLKCFDRVEMLDTHVPDIGMELAKNHNPDLILLDINMPGLTGYEMLNILRRNPLFSNTPIVALTANAMPKEIEKGVEAGFSAYLTKPLVVDSFIETIRQMLESKERNDDA